VYIREYISHCDSSLNKQAFLKSVLSINANLDIKMLAEGIERIEELDFCKTIGVHYAQGYYIGKPSPELARPLMCV
jgi:EAL domain-containing protein (putative c-di-GMP-specific phosphodiesterase class I)